MNVLLLSLLPLLIVFSNIPRSTYGQNFLCSSKPDILLTTNENCILHVQPYLSLIKWDFFSVTMSKNQLLLKFVRTRFKTLKIYNIWVFFFPLVKASLFKTKLPTLFCPKNKQTNKKLEMGSFKTRESVRLYPGGNRSSVLSIFSPQYDAEMCNHNSL